LIDPLVETVEALGPAEILKLLREKLDFDRYIIDEDIPTADDVIIENLNQLQLSAARYDTIASFLEYTDSFADSKMSEDKDGISLMTIHKSKGLEFRAVFVIGMVENLLPSAKGNIEEERRICFVAISRAKDLLYLSYPLAYLSQPSKKSIFIDEILGKKEREEG
jgi:DNA helicase-2/ATP-dependent DNA helicase PcrA